MKKLLLVCALITLSALAFADKPFFVQQASGVYYGQYDGTVKYLYVNAYNQILLYFDTPINLSETSGYTQYYGVPAIESSAAVININDNPEFAKLFYATALTAQSLGKKISIQLVGVSAGLAKIDKIWLAE